MIDSATATNRYDESITVQIGDIVGFKCDIEQGGKIIAIEMRHDETRHEMRYATYVLVLENEQGFVGEYIGGDTVTRVDLNDCWID